MKLNLFISSILAGSILLVAGCQKDSVPATDVETTEGNSVVERPTEMAVVISEENLPWQKALEAAVESVDLVGAAGLIMHDSEITQLAIAGEKQLGQGVPISGDEVWHIGSITKSMTATMIGRLVEQGVLSWDTTIGEAFRSDDIDPAWNDVALRQLLTHTSGSRANFSSMSQTIWPDNPAALNKARRDWTMGVMREPPLFNPGEDFIYSNVGYTIAGVMAEKLSGYSWETLVIREVFEPLGLLSGGFGAPYSIDGKPVAWGHSGALTGKKAHDPIDRADNTPIIGPAGIIHMNLQDLAKYGQEHIRGMNGTSDYLKPETFEVLHTPDRENYAMGWSELGTRPWAEGDVSYHNGSNTMWYALLVLLKDQDMVYAIAANDGNVAAADPAFIQMVSKFNKTIIEAE